MRVCAHIQQSSLQNKAHRIHAIFIETAHILVFCKHSRRFEIRAPQFRAMRNLQRAQSAKFPAQLATSAEREVPRAEIASVSHHTARRKRRTVCHHKELQSTFIPFMTSERMSCKSLRTDKRKTLRGFSSPDFSDGDISADAFYGTSLKISAYFTGI